MTVSLHQYQSIPGLAEACGVDGADHIDKDMRPEMFHLANADQSLTPAAHHRFFVGIKLMERRQDRLVEALGRSGLGSMRECAKEYIGMKDDVVLRDIRALTATDAARRGAARPQRHSKAPGAYVRQDHRYLHQRSDCGCFRDSDGLTLA